jgi:hypothetical protein
MYKSKKRKLLSARVGLYSQDAWTDPKDIKSPIENLGINFDDPVLEELERHRKFNKKQSMVAMSGKKM